MNALDALNRFIDVVKIEGMTYSPNRISIMTDLEKFEN